MKRLGFVLGLISVVFCCPAMVRVPAVLSSNMVLQQKTQVRVWGWSEPGEKIGVFHSWDQHTDSVVGDRDGKWQLMVATPAAGGPYMVRIQGTNTIVLDNVYIGEVWVCSGQSNMEMCESWGGGLRQIERVLSTCKNEHIRFFHVPKTTAVYPQEDCDAKWAVCDSSELKKFSAVAYFFGKQLNAVLNVPVGLIEAAWGGTPAEVWTPGASVNGDSILFHTAQKQKPTAWWPYMPGYCYNAMIAPLQSYSVAGVIWYQGESNTTDPSDYQRLFSTMIQSWRKGWSADLPFYYVQIAPFKYEIKNQGALLREQQAKAMATPNTGMVVISDLVEDTADIHPKNKGDVGLRLASWALSGHYGVKGLVYRSPMYQQMTKDKNRLTLTFADAPEGLTIRGGEAKEMFVAGEDRRFYPAKVKVKGSSLIVWSSMVSKPVAVRYQFDNAGIGNIFSSEGLPLAPFRSDDWEVPMGQ